MGNLQDLVGKKLIEVAEIEDQQEIESLVEPKHCYDSYTWTFYKFVTESTIVVVKWLGESNGYYNETPNLEKV